MGGGGDTAAIFFLPLLLLTFNRFFLLWRQSQMWVFNHLVTDLISRVFLGLEIEKKSVCSRAEESHEKRRRRRRESQVFLEVR